MVPASAREARLCLDTPIVITGVGWARPQFVERVAIEDMSKIGCRLETRAHSGCSNENDVSLQADSQTVRS